MTLKIGNHVDSLAVSRSRGNVVQGGAGWGLPPFSQSAFGLASQCAGPFFFGPAFRLLVLYPPVDFVPVDTVVAADLEKRKMAGAEQFVNRAVGNLQIFS